MINGDIANKLIADALGVSEAEVTLDTTIESTDAWDSLAHFRVVLALEEALGRTLTPVEIFELNGFESVVTVLNGELADYPA